MNGVTPLSVSELSSNLHFTAHSITFSISKAENINLWKFLEYAVIPNQSLLLQSSMNKFVHKFAAVMHRYGNTDKVNF